MSVKIPIETSARHIHINEADFKKLFGEEAQLTYDTAYDFSRRGQECAMAIYNSPVPVIAAVDGYALGGGMELILAADITVAAKTAKIGVPTINLGGIPCWTATQLLPRIVGHSVASDILLTGKIMSAEECYRLHLVEYLTEKEELMEEINLYEIATDCVRMLQINAEKHKVKLTVSGEDAVIRANRGMMEELLYNLCDNAIRYNYEDGLVHVTVKPKQDRVLLTVADTGIGISEEHQGRVFERFYRVDKSRSKSTGGTGLGLAIVKHIVVQSNAEIELHSEKGIGTEIKIIFPKIKEKE